VEATEEKKEIIGPQHEYIYTLWEILIDVEGNVHPPGEYAHVLEGIHAPMC
jgi:hypothetical protein